MYTAAVLFSTVENMVRQNINVFEKRVRKREGVYGEEAVSDSSL